MNNNRKTALYEDCVKYFRDNEAYKRIFSEMRKKWRSYGRVSGTIFLTNASDDEREALYSFLGRSFDKGRVKFQMSEFENMLQETKFKGISLKELLEGYFCEKLTTNKEVSLEKAKEKHLFFETIIKELTKNKIRYKDTIKWIKHISEEKKCGYTLIIGEYERNKDNIKSIIMNVCNAVVYLQSIGDNRIRLAVLSAEVTLNPHYFDRDNVAGRLLIYALSYIKNIDYPITAEEILELYYISNIKPDDISSFTTAYGINLYTVKGEHPAYKVFIEKNEPYLITLLNLNAVEKADCTSRQVFIFENQMVFSHMCEELAGMPVSMICTSGQIKTASLILIDLLCQSNCTLYYSGDIDPEGIKIADKVIARDPLHIIPWRMSSKDYELSASNEKLDELSLKKLEKVEDERFKDVIEALRSKKCAGYQELLIDAMLYDIKEKMKFSDMQTAF